ncbi:MAG: hypothetical protein Q8R07_03400 [Candidatus Uhrbacteria bacterium]|nr:hypothetical protein [Candidatus Uhrbacteria bacterium]
MYALKPVLEQIRSELGAGAPQAFFLQGDRSYSDSQGLRAAEILKKIGITLNDRVLIVDEFVHTGSSLHNATQAFCEKIDGLHMTAYAVAG